MKPGTRHIAGLVVLVAISTVGVIAFVTVWQLTFFGMFLCFGSVLGLILVLVALAVRRRAREKESPGLSRVSTGLLLIGIFLLIQGAYYPIALSIRNMEVKRTQNYINALIPKLEEYARLNNEYPASLNLTLTGVEDLPRLLQLNGGFPLQYDNRQYYFQRERTYGFQFYVPDGFIGFHYEYCCGTDGEWTVTD